ncbi:hypothetical protein [Actinomadura livida]|uniref:Uncharacterized protein n=1 Tax=Actinomadura livida TaxID=79909 RepID=A0A7W7MVA7_9ACTN|nr:MULTISPECIES: hypothetical protein [Actinomadura]MBB4772358.1 hypothetical protein [Actinomadura catellatispora]
MVKAEAWRLVTEDGEWDLPEALHHWDYQMDLRLRRSVRVDLDRAHADSALAPNVPLTLAAVWTSTGSNLRGPAQRVPIEGSGMLPVELDVRLRGTELGGVLILDTALVLAEGSPDGAFAAPRRAGSVLWSDRRSLRLQGDAAQFPMAVIDFAKTSFPDRAAWHLQIGERLEAATMGSLLLLINERNETAATAFKNAANPRPVDKVILSTIYGDAARIMIEHALRHGDFGDDAAFGEDSLGSTLIGLCTTLFPGASINELRLRQEQSPSLFASELQAAVGIWEVV